ncbi:unnamed protein product, partial [Polarella glacialis]
MDGNILDQAGWKSMRWLSFEAQQARRNTLGLQQPRTAAFAEAHEFVSLGCFCGVARALQALGLKRQTYPFDWLRCSVEGVLYCLKHGFKDFLKVEAVCKPKGSVQDVFEAAWGGSFWHHDPREVASVTDFSRRIQRFLGRGEVPAKHPWVFIHAVNATCDLLGTPRMLESLKESLKVSAIRLLVMVDCQKRKGGP